MRVEKWLPPKTWSSDEVSDSAEEGVPDRVFIAYEKDREISADEIIDWATKSEVSGSEVLKARFVRVK